MVELRPPPVPPPARPPARPPAGPPTPPSPPAVRVLTIVLCVLLGLIALVGAAIVVVVAAGDDPGPGPGPDPTESTSQSVPAGQDEQAIAGAEAIAQGAESYAGTYGYGPSVDDALPTGLLAQFVDPWPTNPYTGQPMTQGTAPGDYVFHTAISMGDGEEYLGYVDVYLSTGETYSAPFEY